MEILHLDIVMQNATYKENEVYDKEDIFHACSTTI